MRVLIYVVSFLCGTAGLIIAFWYVLRSGRVIGGILIGWGLSIICVFLVSVLLPGVLAVVVGHEEYSQLFPEEIGVFAIAVTGWLPASVVAIIAAFARHGTKGLSLRSGRSRIRKQNGQEDNCV